MSPLFLGGILKRFQAFLSSITLRQLYNICINAKKSIVLNISMFLYKTPRYFRISSLKWILKKAGGLQSHLHVKKYSDTAF